MLLIFVLFSVIPGSIVSSLNDDGRGPMDAQVVERMKKELGLDDPMHVRFTSYIGKLAMGDFGTSFRTREPVTTMLAKRAWPTLQLIFAAMLLAIVIGVPLGFVAALRPGSLVDTLSMVGRSRACRMPKFWLGLLLMYLFALKLGWLPSFGYGDGAEISDPACRDARRLADGAAGAHDAGGGARDHDRRFRPHRALERHERDPRREMARHAQCARADPDDDRPAVRRADGAGGRGRETVLLAGHRLAAGRQRAAAGHSRRARVRSSSLVLFFLAINTLVDLLYVVIDPRIKYA